MLVTEKWIKEKYILFNDLFFEGSLPMITFKISRSKKTWGYASFRWFTNSNEPHDLTLTMSNYYDSPEEIKIATLLHEMIHIYDYYMHFTEHYYRNGRKVRGYDAHGVWFLKWADKINSMSPYKIATHVLKEEVEQSVYSERTLNNINNKLARGYNIVFLKVKAENKYYMMKCNDVQIEKMANWCLTGRRWKGVYGPMYVYKCYDKAYVERRCSSGRSIAYVSEQQMLDKIKELKLTPISTLGDLKENSLLNTNLTFDYIYDIIYDYNLEDGDLIIMS